MRQAALALMLLILGCAGCMEPQVPLLPPAPRIIRIEYPTVNVPLALRQSNWGNPGRCMYASTISLLRWQGRNDLADRLLRDLGGNTWPTSLAEKLQREGIRFGYTTKGDIAFLEWAVRTRRGCGIVVSDGNHMVGLVSLDAERAGLLDNNDISRIRWVPRDQLIVEWRRSGGGAISPIYTPAAPLPQ